MAPCFVVKFDPLETLFFTALFLMVEGTEDFFLKNLEIFSFVSYGYVLKLTVACEGKSFLMGKSNRLDCLYCSSHEVDHLKCASTDFSFMLLVLCCLKILLYDKLNM